MHVFPHYLINLFSRNDRYKELRTKSQYLDWGAWPPWSEHRSQSTGTHSGESVSPSPRHFQRCSAHSPSRGREELRWENRGRKDFLWYLVQWFPTFIYFLILNILSFPYKTERWTFMFSEKTELQEFLASTDRTIPWLLLSGSGHPLYKGVSSGTFIYFIFGEKTVE